jgi:DNA-binding CsgD family transcriptional regulator
MRPTSGVGTVAWSVEVGVDVQMRGAGMREDPALARLGTRRLTVAPTARRTGVAQHDLALGPADLRGVLRLLDDAEQATDSGDFRRIVLEGLARYLGFHHSIFFIGSAVENAVRDQNAIGFGLPRDSAEPFAERYRALRALNDPASLRVLADRKIACLEEIGTPESPEANRALMRFLRGHGFHSTMMIMLSGPPSRAAVIALFTQQPSGFGPRDRAVGAMLGRHLGSLIRFYLNVSSAPAVTVKLTPREREVVGLVAEGMTNRQVAAALSISIETVKHHLTHALVVTGCANRTQLALAWHREIGSALEPLPAAD